MLSVVALYDDGKIKNACTNGKKDREKDRWSDRQMDKQIPL
jgi:hypothetical protein